MEYPLLKLGVIDIGSNAVRCQISAVLLYEDNYRLKRVEYVRYPMRLGEDVFATGEISPAKRARFVKFLHALKLLMEVHDVSHYLVCATSAMRTATNAAAIVAEVGRELGMHIEVIDGQAEAAYINRVIEHLLEDNKHYLHIDVGGGSTEFNIYHDRRKVASQSFEVGSIRRMQQEEAGADGMSFNSTWDRMEAWVRTNARRYHVTRAIGTGGNINKIYSMSKSGSKGPITRKHHCHPTYQAFGRHDDGRARERGHAQPRPRRRHPARRPHLPLGDGVGRRQHHARARHRPEGRHDANPIRGALRGNPPRLRPLRPDALPERTEQPGSGVGS